MYFAFMYENRIMELVKIILKRNEGQMKEKNVEVNLRCILSTNIVIL
jgi:hypothetical protein